MAQRLLNLTIAFSAWASATILDPSRSGVAVLLAQPRAQSPATSHSVADRKQGRELIVNADGVQAYEFPHIEAPVLATLSKNTAVYELRRVTNWIEVRGPKERLGWMEAKGLSVGKDTEQQPRSNSSVKGALTAAAIAALIVKEGRQAYYATGRPCACPDDVTRGGRQCGATSAYSRPGGARPFCYPSDVPQSRVDEYRAKLERTMAGQ